MSKNNIKTILITGASKGIGLSTAQKFAKSEGGLFNVVMISRKSEYFTNEVNEIKGLGVDVHQVEADFSILSDIKKAISYLITNNINIDILVNNAGYTNPNGFMETEMDDFRHTLEVNLLAPFYLIRELFKNGNHPEHIVNIASTAGIGARPGWVSYAASKAAFISMSDTLRDELKVFGTKVICLSPGRCATSLREKLAPDEDPTTIMQPDSVADSIFYLTSTEGDFLTSQNLVVR